MNRFRIWGGFFALLFAVPLYVVSIVRTESPGELYLITAITVALGLALLFPRRWI